MSYFGRMKTLLHQVTVKKYRCETCGKGSQVEFKDEFKKDSGIPVEL